MTRNTDNRAGGGAPTALLASAMVLLLLGALLASACWQVESISKGREFPYSRALAIKKHLFTTRDVRELLGEPLQETELGPRRRRWRYFCQRQQAQRLLLFFDTKVVVTEQEVIVDFDGTLVSDVKHRLDTYER